MPLIFPTLNLIKKSVFEDEATTDSFTYSSAAIKWMSTSGQGASALKPFREPIYALAQ
jgi:hypothetical protein